MRSRTLAVAGSIAALSLAAVPIAAASPGGHPGSDSKLDRTHHVDMSRDGKSSRDRSRDRRDRPSRDVHDPQSRDVRDW
jgi:hypothetical protein